MTKRVCIYWRVSPMSQEYAYCVRRIGLRRGMSVNGESYCDVNETQYRMLIAASSRGWLTLRNKNA